ncbi:MAG: SDR family NAD(P)-dependent oxidoreductase [Acidobacteriota bacterium]|nr:SDR family NAD(P)-dependent oxidoreductase [Acidobacteriota bacterium]
MGTSREPVAITGYSYRMPGGIRSDEDFWRLLRERDIVQEPITGRYGRGYRPIGKSSAFDSRFASSWEGLIRDGEELLFDCRLFGLSVQEASYMDPQIKMLLTCAWETFERAGWNLHRLRNSRTGVFVGAQMSAAATWRQADVNMFGVPGRSSAMLANRISYHFNLMGPSMACMTACSASLSALHEALNAIRCGDCEAAVVGGVTYLGSPSTSIGASALGIISPDGKCYSFDAAANGYMRSEGVFVVAIKPLDAAERDGDRIHAVIEGTALNAAGTADDGRGLGQARYITAPTRHAQVAVMRAACAGAGMASHNIDYVEAHATGTQMGDQIEGNAIGEAYGGFERGEPLRLASVKSNVGHMEASAFHCSLLKVVLMMQRRTFAPISKNFTAPNPEIDFEGQNLRVQTTCEPFPERPVAVGINSFGFGGANGHCIVREYRPAATPRRSVSVAPAAGHLVPLSARTSDALVRTAEALRDTLRGDETDLYTVAGNLSRRRTHFATRTAFAVETREELVEALDGFARDPDPVTTRDEGERRLAMVFAGQGTQWAGCARSLYDTHPVFRRAVDAIEAHWRDHSDVSIRRACFEASQEDLDECELAQPVIFMVQCALVELFKTWGVYPDCVVGHSAGEVAAAYACGALSLADATRVIYHRATLQQRTAGSGRMLAVGLDRLGVEDLLASLNVSQPDSTVEEVQIACENSPASTVLCAREDALRPVMAELDRRNLYNRLIPGNIAFHSMAMDPIRDDLIDALSFLDDAAFEVDVPMISSVTGVEPARLDAAYWWSNVRRPVRFAAAMKTVRQVVRPGLVLEIAPHSALQTTIRQCFEDSAEPPRTIPTLMRDADARIGFHQALGRLFCAGAKLDFAAQYPRPKNVAHRLPGHPKDERRVIEPLIDDAFFVGHGPSSRGPLVGRVMPGARYCFESFLSAQNFPWLSDHRVNQVPIMPATGYLELVMEAVGEGPVHFSEIEFVRPCPVPAARSVRLQTALRPVSDAEGKYTFTISSQPLDLSAESTLHCQGAVRRVGPEAEVDAPPRLADIDRTRYAPTRFVERADFYDRVHAVVGDSFQFGPSFQTVHRIDIDVETKQLLADVSMDETFWATGREEGYVCPPPLLDGGLQLLAFFMLESVDFSGAPRQATGITVFRPPSTPRVTCLMRVPKHRTALHEKGQFSSDLGRVHAGSLSFYDTVTGDLVCHIADVVTFNYNNKSRRTDLAHSKHVVAWQPKFVDLPLAAALPDGDVEPAALIEALEQSALDGLERRACRTIEFAGTRSPDETTLNRCLEYLTGQSSHTECWLLGEDQESTQALFDAFHHRDASLRFECFPLDAESAELDRGLLRRGAAELLFLHADVKEAGRAEWQLLRDLAVPGGLALVRHNEGDVIAPKGGWKVWRPGTNTTLLQAPRTYRGARSNRETAELVRRPRWVVGEPGSHAAEWMSLIRGADVHEVGWDGLADGDAASIGEWPHAADVEAIDFFCGADPEDPTGAELTARFAAFVKALVSRRLERTDHTRPCRVTVATRRAAFEVEDPRGSALWGAVRTMSLEVAEKARLDFRLVDLGASSDLKTLAWLDRCDLRERELAIRQRRVWAPRVVGIPDEFPAVPRGEDPPYRLFLDRPGQVTGLRMKTCEPRELGPHDVEIEVRAAALNFRDVMVTLDRLPPLSYERSALGREVGVEASGIVRRAGSAVGTCRLGDEVIFLNGGCIANRVVVHQGAVFVKPGNLGMVDAAAGPTVDLTAYYALIHLGQLRRGERVLIHSGMGGVGRAAVALAKNVGAEIYATAGSADKRDRLLDLGVKAAFDSHSFSWYADLMRATDGKGVDVVLNALAGHHIALCLEALRPCGRHLEIGKVDIYADSALGLRVFRKNLRFAAIDIDSLIIDDPFLARELLQDCLDLYDKGALPVVPTAVYGYGDVVKALRLLMNGQHQGKLVVEAPAATGAPGFPIADERPFLDPDATYLLTGGLGGLGLRMVAFLVASGARHLTLMDRDSERRRSADWVRQASGIDDFFPNLRDGIEIDIVPGDVSVPGDVERCIAQLSRPLKGVFHLAGIVDDQLLRELTPDSVARVFAPKAGGALNLHRATADCPLDHFVLFSSISSTFGNPGQINYGAANAFLDGLAALRRRRGRPALSYNLAAVVEAGMASRDLQILRLMKTVGLPPVSSVFAVTNLDYAMRVMRDQDHLITACFEHPLWRGDAPDYMRSGRLTTNQDAFEANRGGQLTVGAVAAQITAKVAELCGGDEIDPEQPLASFGFSSLSIAELGAFIQRDFGYRVGAVDLMTTTTALSLATSIVQSQAGLDGSEEEPDADVAAVEQDSARRRSRRTPSIFAPALEDHFALENGRGDAPQPGWAVAAGTTPPQELLNDTQIRTTRDR